MVSATTACKMIAHVYRVEGKHAVAGQLETVTIDSPLLGEPGHINHNFTATLYWKMASTLGVDANMLQVCFRFRARSTNVSIS